jgi:hypothetical protein
MSASFRQKAYNQLPKVRTSLDSIKRNSLTSEQPI